MKDAIYFIIIIGLVAIIATLVLFIAGYAHADIDNGIQFLRSSFQSGVIDIESFKDNKTDVICYVAVNRWTNSAAAISCVK